MAVAEAALGTRSRDVTPADYFAKKPILAARDSAVLAKQAFQERFLVPGKLEQVAELAKNAGITHLALITDKNQTWATQRGLDTRLGHMAGGKRVVETIDYVRKAGLKSYTAWVLSPENVDNRKPEQINEVCDVVDALTDGVVDHLRRTGGKLIPIGRLSRIRESTRDKLLLAQEETSSNGEYTVHALVDYNSENERLELVSNAFERALDGRINPAEYLASSLEEQRRAVESMDEELSKTQRVLSDVDVLIRTGVKSSRGNQSVYLSRWGKSAENAELYGVPEPLPMLGVWTVLKKVEDAAKKERKNRKAGS